MGQGSKLKPSVKKRKWRQKPPEAVSASSNELSSGDDSASEFELSSIAESASPSELSSKAGPASPSELSYKAEAASESESSESVNAKLQFGISAVRSVGKSVVKPSGMTKAKRRRMRRQKLRMARMGPPLKPFERQSVKYSVMEDVPLQPFKRMTREEYQRMMAEVD